MTTRLLLIEDNPGDARLVREMLRDPDGDMYAFAHVTRLAAGLELLANLGYDVVLLDLSLPDSQGIDTLARVLAADPSVAVIVLTGLDDETLGMEAVRMGAQDYFRKSELVSDYSLRRAVRHAVERQRLVVEMAISRERIAQSESQMRTILDSYSEGILILDPGDLIVYANKEAIRLLGRSSEELLGSVCDLPAAPNGRHELENPQRSSRKIIVELRFLRIAWEQSPARLVSLRDITESVRIQEIERRLALAKDELVATTSHELRTPLHAIRGFLSLLKSGKVPDEATKVEFLGRAAQEADRLSTLLDDLLDMARLEAGHLSLAMEEVDLDSIVQTTLAALESLAMSKGCPLNYYPSPRAILLRTDSRRVQQVLVNLVGNAIKFSTGKSAVEVRTSQEAGAAIIQVLDHGPGIPREDMAKLFSRFYQIDGTVSSAAGGTGLGLAISMELVEAMGGMLEVESEVGVGSAFVVSLPLARETR